MTTVLVHELMTLGTASARIGVEWQRQPARYLTIDGVPAYQIAYSCGTCGMVLRREPAAPSTSMPATEVRDHLNAGLDELDGAVIEAFSSQLPRADYLVMLLDVQPQLATPGSIDDYFTTDGPTGWQNEEFEYTLDPANISYYRLGQRSVGEHDHLFEFAVPMTEPASLDETTTTQYANASGHPTAVAFGLLDIEGPWFRRERHWGLFHFLLDGHHKTAAAATADTPLRLMTFVSATDSFASDHELLRLPDLLQTGNTARFE
jgi:hypothetical protein